MCLIAYVLVFQAERAPPLYCASCRWDFVGAAGGEARGAVHGVEHVHGQLREGTVWKRELPTLN